MCVCVWGGMVLSWLQLHVGRLSLLWVAPRQGYAEVYDRRNLGESNQARTHVFILCLFLTEDVTFKFLTLIPFDTKLYPGIVSQTPLPYAAFFYQAV